MDGLDNRKISWPIAGNPPEHTERVGEGTFLRAFLFAKGTEENSRHGASAKKRGGKRKGESARKKGKGVATRMSDDKAKSFFLRSRRIPFL